MSQMGYCNVCHKYHDLDVTGCPAPVEWQAPQDVPRQIPYACPVCNGHGTVSRPPWVAGDQDSWIDNGTGPYPCRACGGTGIIWAYLATWQGTYNQIISDSVECDPRFSETIDKHFWELV